MKLNKTLFTGVMSLGLVAGVASPTFAATAFAEGIMNGSFESYTGKNGWTIMPIEGWTSVDAKGISKTATIDLDSLKKNKGVEIWRNYKGKKMQYGQNKIELDGYANSVDALYQKFTAKEDTKLSFMAYARSATTSDIEVYIDGKYVETVMPKVGKMMEYTYPITKGDHSIMFKEVDAQDNGLGALIDNVRLTMTTDTKKDSEDTKTDMVVKASTKTGLDTLIQIIQNDEGIKKQIQKGKVTAEDVKVASEAANKMNHIIVDAIEKLDLADDKKITPEDVVAISAYIEENHKSTWVELHGDDEKGEETGYHRVQNDGAKSKLFGTNALNKVADGIYHLGFGTNKKGNRLLNEDGNDNASIKSVAYWLNSLLSDDLDLTENMDTRGKVTHDFYSHARYMLGKHTLSPDAVQYGGYEFVNENKIVARAPLTGLRPVIEQAIDTVKEDKPRLKGKALERAVANELTQLNDFNQLTKKTQENLMILTGLDIKSMTKKQREKTTNHLQHSPLPFGDIEKVLSPKVKIDLGYTHTLDKDKTRIADLGNGVFKVWMISNNNNGSHTGHNLGSFKVQLEDGIKAKDAKEIANNMVKNTNNNDKLYLAEGAKSILYGAVKRLDYSNLSKEEKRAKYAGNTEPMKHMAR